VDGRADADQKPAGRTVEHGSEITIKPEIQDFIVKAIMRA
jgi:hypothetical protein